MNLVSVEQATKRHAEKLVLDGVSFGIDVGERVGVIGINGSGKSTLLNLIAGADQPDAGRVVLARATRVHHLAQEPSLDPGARPLETVLGADTAQTRTVRAFEGATAALQQQPADADAIARVGAATSAMDAAGAWDVEHRGRAMLERLGLGGLDVPIGRLSGGQRKRVALARALTGAASGDDDAGSLLILDEPTNHLDVDVIEWLEGVLRARTGALAIVTHDRYLLDRVATRIIEVDRGRLHTHDGTYADYLQARAVREEQAVAAERKRASRARVELAWLRRGPKARTSKARYRVDQAKALQTEAAGEPAQALRLDLPARRIGSKVVNLHHVGKRYDGRFVLRGVDHKFVAGQRVGIVGPNGSGKTTLLGLIAGWLEPDEGSVRHGDTVHVGWYGQDPTAFPPRTRVLDAVKEVVLETNTVQGITLSASQLLERFLFTPEAQKASVSELSGGERRRLALLRVLATAPNLLLLDEPTNDLDLDTLAVLEEYLNAWPGTLVVASHDRFFLDRVCDHLFSIEADGSVRHHPGGWSAYRAHASGGAERLTVASTTPRGRTSVSQPRPRKLSYNERRELDRLERRVSHLTERRAVLIEEVQAPGQDYGSAQRRGHELAQVLAELEEVETRWLELAAIEES